MLILTATQLAVASAERDLFDALRAQLLRDIQPVGALQIEFFNSAGDTFIFVDVREVHEYQTARIEGTRLIPLGELPNRLSELDRDAEIVLHCKGGVRSAKALAVLKENGFKDAKHMRGGILAWSDHVDPGVPKY